MRDTRTGELQELDLDVEHRSIGALLDGILSVGLKVGVNLGGD